MVETWDIGRLSFDPRFGIGTTVFRIMFHHSQVNRERATVRFFFGFM